MSTAVVRPPALAVDDQRGSMAMVLFIVTEAMLFVSLFFAYYFLGSSAPSWPPAGEPPSLRFALPMLAVLLLSSGVLHLGEQQVRTGGRLTARLAVLVTIALGAAFLVLQALEYRERLQTLLPTANAYGSIFYTITGVHGLHLGLGLLMLAYVLVLPLEPAAKPPHRPLHNAALYWHFVDLVWIFIVALLYVAPNVAR